MREYAGLKVLQRGHIAAKRTLDRGTARNSGYNSGRGNTHLTFPFITSPRLKLAVGLVSVLYGTMLLLLHTATIYEYGVGGDEWGEIEGTR